jgi:hypothetical protein
MRQAEVFADVLERELRRSAPDVFDGGAHAIWSASPNPFLFASGSSIASAQMVAPAAGPMFSTAPRFLVDETARAEAVPGPPPVPSDTAWIAETPAPVVQQPPRILMAREGRALRELIALGADLQPGFTAADLRSAFRILARLYHPDRHPEADAEKHARLARTFSEVAEHHRCLLAVVEPVGSIRH